jgi:hypothetical protein
MSLARSLQLDSVEEEMEEFLSILEPLPRDLAQYVLCCAVLCHAVLHPFFLFYLDVCGL